MKKLIVKSTNFFIFIICFLSNLSMASAATPTPASRMKNKNISYTFIQTTNRARIEPIELSKDLYRITIKNTPSTVGYFSDRPNRFAGSLSLGQFLHEWDGFNSFTLVPPNVSISGNKPSRSSHKTELNFVTILTNPHYDAIKNTMTYDLKFISAKPVMTNKQIILHNVTLFFDSGSCASCCC